MVSIVGGLLTALVTLLATFRIDLYERERYLNTVHLDAIQHASVLRARLEGALNSRLHLAYGLAAYAKSHHSGDVDHFDDFAEALLQTGIDGIRSLQLAPNAIVKYVHPLKNNQNIIGHDLLADPARRDAVRRTIEERLFVVAGPVKLIQGGVGLIARLPLYKEGPDTPFWGFATVVLDVDPILREGEIHPQSEGKYDIALRGKDAMGAKGDAFVGDSKMFVLSPVTMDIALPHGSWQLAILPKGGWPATSPYSLYIWLAGMILAYFAGGFVFMRINEPAKLRREVERATSALRESEEQFRRVAESASDAIISTDSRGQITFWNQAASDIFGYRASDALGGNLLDLIIPADRRSAYGGMIDLGVGEDSTELGGLIETMATRRDGMQFPVELTLSYWTAGGEVYFTVIIRDITERKQAEQDQAVLRERYYHAQKMEAIGRLASGAAHEFNNSLNSLLANAEAAMAELPEGSPASAPLYEVLNCGWRAAEIVRQLLISSEKGAEEAPVIAPYVVINQLMARLRAQVPDTISIVDQVEALTGEVSMDYDQFCHLVWNLFMNACKAMLPTGGTLTVALKAVAKTDEDFRARATANGSSGGEASSRLAVGQLNPGHYAQLSIGDTGAGMDQETLSRIFDPFFTTSPVGVGSGLGLSVVHGMVQSRGGGILVCSTVGRGTTFDVYLPLITVPAQ